MKLLHTSDWHLGRSLCGKQRYEEFDAFLQWLATTVNEHAIDALVIAGDVFDTSAPSHRAQGLYYRFLGCIAASRCRHVVVIAGNHDSPSLLNAPKDLLEALSVHVVGAATPVPAEEVLVLRDNRGEPELIVCAVPYLRDRDIRVADAGESVQDKEQKLRNGIRDHYAAVTSAALQTRQELATDAPMVATGHLFVTGGQTVDGDGVRDLYVGSLADVGADVFSDSFRYVALGHLHVPQTVQGCETMRYSGSPIAMGFGEAGQQKSVCEVEFRGTETTVTLVDIPVFRPLDRIQGDWNIIANRLANLTDRAETTWLEVVYDGEEVLGDLRDRIEALTTKSAVEVLRVKNLRVIEQVLHRGTEEESLDDLSEYDVFDRCLAMHRVPANQRDELVQTYREAIASLDQDEDTAALLTPAPLVPARGTP